MKKELDEKLVKKYPKIFRDRYEDMQLTAMCWGFDCSDGWYKLIDNLCSNLQWNIDKNHYPQVIASQVKEKYGGLKFYVQSANDKQHAVISFAEGLSYSICEQCGAYEGVYCSTNGTHAGWIKTLCLKCAKLL